MTEPAQPPEPQGHHLLRLPVVMAKTGMGRSTIYRKMEAGEFPLAVALGDNSVAWYLGEVDAWIERRPRVKLRRSAA